MPKVGGAGQWRLKAGLGLSKTNSPSSLHCQVWLHTKNLLEPFRHTTPFILPSAEVSPVSSPLLAHHHKLSPRHSSLQEKGHEPRAGGSRPIRGPARTPAGLTRMQLTKPAVLWQGHRRSLCRGRHVGCLGRGLRGQGRGTLPGMDGAHYSEGLGWGELSSLSADSSRDPQKQHFL